MAKNYIKHEVEVQFMEQYYAKDTEWQWFIDRIEQDFDFEDISNWKGYEELCWRLIELYGMLEKIVEVGSNTLSIIQPILMDLFEIANYRMGVSDVNEASASITTKFGRTFFLVVWATKLEKQNNSIEYIYDNDLFTLRNIWQSRNLISLELYGEDLISYGESISLIGIDERIACLQDNISKVYYGPQKGFVDEIKKTYPLKGLFGYQSKQVKVSSWQERIIVGLINNGFNRNHKSYPIENIFMDSSSDDISHQLRELKLYFTNETVDYIIETVLFLWNGVEPSTKSKCMYFDICKQFFESDEYHCSFNNYGFWAVSNLFAKGMTSDVRNTVEFLGFLNSIHTVETVYDLQRLIDNKIPLSKDQKAILREYQETAYKKVDDINNPQSLMEYMRRDIVCKSIDTDYFGKVFEKFLLFLGDNSIQRILPSFFYDYMVFLIKTKNMSINVNKREIDKTVIIIQKLWEKQYYNMACKDLQRFSAKTEISMAEIEKFNQDVLLNPFALARICMKLDEKSVCEIMERASENPIMYMFSRIALSKIYPMKNEEINLVRHDVDGYLSDYIGKIKEKKKYRFMNVLENNKYLMALYEDIHLCSRIFISMFHKEQMIYEQLVEKCDIQLLEYTDELLLAHVTQLFPILEQRIRMVSSIFGVSPFKEDINSFMQFKDPSSLLREMIAEAYIATGNFELIYDLMFVYTFMYNSNSLNIRNECIHGRGYNTPGEIRFAYRVTLLSIYMMEHRIDHVIAME